MLRVWVRVCGVSDQSSIECACPAREGTQPIRQRPWQQWTRVRVHIIFNKVVYLTRCLVNNYTQLLTVRHAPTLMRGWKVPVPTFHCPNLQLDLQNEKCRVSTEEFEILKSETIIGLYEYEPLRCPQEHVSQSSNSTGSPLRIRIWIKLLRTNGTSHMFNCKLHSLRSSKQITHEQRLTLRLRVRCLHARRSLIFDLHRKLQMVNSAIDTRKTISPKRAIYMPQHISHANFSMVECISHKPRDGG